MWVPPSALRLAKNSCGGMLDWLAPRDSAALANRSVKAGFSAGRRVDVSPEQLKGEVCVCSSEGWRAKAGC